MAADGPSVFNLVKQVAAELKHGATRHDASVKKLNTWLSLFEKSVDGPLVEPQAGSCISGGSSCLPTDDESGGSDGFADLSCFSEHYKFFVSPSGAVSKRYQELLDQASDADGSIVSEIESPMQCSEEDIFPPKEKRVLESQQMPAWMKALFAAHNEELHWRQRVLAHLKYCVLGVVEPTRRLDALLGLASWLAAAIGGVKLVLTVGKACMPLVKALWDVMFPPREEEAPAGVEPQSVHREQKVYPVKKAATTVPSAVAQLGNPPQNHLNDIIYRNSWKLVADGKNVGQVLFVRGTVALMPWHFRRDLSEAQRIEMISCGAGGLRANMTGKDFGAVS